MATNTPQAIDSQNVETGTISQNVEAGTTSQNVETGTTSQNVETGTTSQNVETGATSSSINPQTAHFYGQSAHRTLAPPPPATSSTAYYIMNVKWGKALIAGDTVKGKTNGDLHWEVPGDRQNAKWRLIPYPKEGVRYYGDVYYYCIQDTKHKLYMLRGKFDHRLHTEIFDGGQRSLFLWRLEEAKPATTLSGPTYYLFSRAKIQDPEREYCLTAKSDYDDGKLYIERNPQESCAEWVFVTAQK